MDFKDYYKILGVEKSVTAAELSTAYRRLARKYSPDVNPDDKVAEERFTEINQAHQVLSTPEARLKYEQLETNWYIHQQSETQDNFDWSWWVSKPEETDFFQAIFTDLVIEKDAPRPQKGPDYNQTVEITLEEAFSGAARILRVSGRRLEIKIPRGAQSGTKVRIRGEGAEGTHGGSKGDLYLEINVKPHDLFKPDGDDLYLDLPVNLYSAVLGGEAFVTTIRGKIKLRIPPETQSGRIFRLKGQGMPKLKNPEERGDLYAKVMVTLPENLSDQEIGLFEELADIRGL